MGLQYAGVHYQQQIHSANGIKEKPRGVITPIKAMTLDEINANREEFTKTGLETILLIHRYFARVI